MTSSLDQSTGEGAVRQHYGVTFAVLALACASFALLQSAVAPALPEIKAELNASSASTAWIFTGYLLSASVLTPIGGRLGDMFGKERMLVAALCVLAAGTLLAALAQSISVMILARVIQGAGGAIFPLSFGIIRDEFPPDRAAQGIAMVSALLAIGGGLGIVLAGPVINTFDYHWLFWFPLVVVVGATVAAIFFVPESPITSPGRIDWSGALLLSAWLVLLLFGITKSADWGWGDPRVFGLLAAAAVVLALWIRFERRVSEPLVDMKMMAIRGVWTVNAAAFLVGAGMFSSFILVPEFTQMPVSTGYGYGATVTEAGLFMVPTTLAMMIVSPIGGQLATTVGSRVILLAGCLITAGAFGLMAVAHSAEFMMYVATGMIGAGIGLAFAALANLIVEAVPHSQTSVATGMNTVMRSLGGSVGGQVGASIIAGTVVGSALPTESGFTLAFLFAAVACLLAALVTTAVPRRPSSLSPVLASTVPARE